MTSHVWRGLLVCVCLATFAAAEAPRRLALVIGNAAYQSAPLRNPVNDATDMDAVLRRLGFEVTILRNADRRAMGEAIETFSQKLRKGGVGLFYFSGHGIQVRGENYLVPLGATINREQDAEYEAVSVGRVLGGMDDAGNALNIIILDACRNNPYARSFRSSARGLAVVQAARGSLIAYATSPGSVADDGSSRNGVYTQYLLKAIVTPGLSVEQVFKKVRTEVIGATGDKQRPWESSSLTEEFYFVAPQGASPSSAARSDPEATMWALVEQSANPEDVRDFLTAYPNGRFAPAARVKLRQLERQPAATPPGGTQVAVGVYPQPAEAPKTQRNSIGMEFVLIPAGEFRMGSNDGGNEEKPVHTVRISKAFYLGKYEVTQGQWQAVMGNNPSSFTGDANLPVEQVSWEDAQDFIRKLNAREGGTKYRLPTEAEWEYAARAGAMTAYSFGDDARQLGNYAWYDENAANKTHPVGQLQPNVWGLYDMHGNVSEWVQDWYGEYVAASVTDPQGPASGSHRVLRDGSWDDFASRCRAAARGLNPPGGRNGGLGVRLLRTAE
jgi:formylglycine-generating enzyme required for sulfatase activity